jgi:hypothetical protein
MTEFLKILEYELHTVITYISFFMFIYIFISSVFKIRPHADLNCEEYVLRL